MRSLIGSFKLFVGCVLLYIGVRLLKELIFKSSKSPAVRSLEEKFRAKTGEITSGQTSKIAAVIPASLKPESSSL